MNKKILIGTIFLLVVSTGIYFFQHRTASQKSPAAESPVFDARNSTFTIDGKTVTLSDGSAEELIPGSASKITTGYFGNEAHGDLNGDGLEDRAFLVTQTTGGSGTFYYAVAALQNADGYTTTNAFLIGDRIAPQSTEIHSDSGQLSVNYADRKAGEPMTAKPSQGKTLFLKVTQNGVLEETAQ